MRALFKDIKGLVGCYENPPNYVAGDDMKNFPVLENAWMEVVGEKIIGLGSMSTGPKTVLYTHLTLPPTKEINTSVYP